MADWRASASFFGRFSCVTELQQALHAARPEKSLDSVKDWAQSIEEHAYQESKTKIEYDSFIKNELHQVKTSTSCQTSISQDTVQLTWEELKATLPSVEPVTIGVYQSAVPFDHGTSSTVFACPNPLHIDKPITTTTFTHDSPAILALKVTNPSLQPAPHDSVREVRILRQLANHSNIIPLMTHFYDKGDLTLVFPHLPKALNIVLRETKTILSSDRKRSILRDVMRGLDYIHSQGIIHRDMKPSNILFTSSGAAQIIDFGTAWSTTDAASEPANQKVLDVGTTSYRAPELLFGDQSYGYSLDMWAAGCVAAEVLVSAEARGRKGDDERSLFVSGDLGSELRLIKSIFETLGTPDENSWPSAAKCPDWGKMTFKDFPRKSWDEILPGVEGEEVAFVEALLKYEAGARMTAGDALRHPYLR